MSTNKFSCWICEEADFKLIKKSDVDPDLSSQNFAITNFNYGMTGELHQCQNCGFIQCADLQEVVKYYEDLEDEEYENTRHERKLQEKRLLNYLGRFKSGGTLLDIGAGSGILVEAALEKGYHAEGIEPSRWLQKNAQALNLPIHQGIFPHPDTPGPYDIVSLVDVIEHVTNPTELLSEIHKVLAEDGIFTMVTPDVRSLAARILGHKWWHYRFAHIGYFNHSNLKRLIDKTGFEVIKMKRPAWYFTLKYLGVRILSFFPKFLRFPLPKFLEKIIIPVNLRDSILVICRKK